MKDRTTSASREWRGDREEIARLLPPPADWDVPREQHLRHKDLLMHTIDRDQADQADRAVRTRPARRLLRPALLAPATALALACALTVGIALTDSDKGSSGTSRGVATDMRPAAALLDQISTAAGERAVPAVRDDQFVYTREKTRGADLTTGKAVLGPLLDHEAWYSQKPGRVLDIGLIREDGETLPLAELGGAEPGISRPTYHWLSSLPTDPDKLLTYLYAKTPSAPGRERDQAVFEQVGSLLGGVMPPRVAAALYRVAAKIPGVTSAPEARDAIGRQGLGIARDDTRYGIRTEWVFDRKDYAFLGSRSYLTKDGTYGKSGTLLSSNAELDHAVVDRAGESPEAGAAG